MTSRVLVTGAGGAIGRVLRERLRTSATVDFTDRRDLDAACAAAVAERARGCFAVLHLASTFREGPIDAARAARDVRMARTVGRAARAAGAARLIFVSSVRSAPFDPARAPPAFARSLNPQHVRASRALERQAAAWAAEGSDVVVIRSGGVWWPDWVPPGPERDVWLSHEDCAAVVRAAIEASLDPGRYACLNAVSATPGRFVDSTNSFGWVARSRRLGAARHVKYRVAQALSWFAVRRDPAAGPDSRSRLR